MKKLSVFVDESGDFGNYEEHSPFYLFTLVFHNQENSITQQIEYLEKRIKELDLQEGHCFHAGPIIRREEDYKNCDITYRRKCLNAITTFAKKTDIRYMSFMVEKRFVKDDLHLNSCLSKQLSEFINLNKRFFDEYDKVIVYYDNGQGELNRILTTVFSILLSNVEFRKVLPVDYKLFQVADLLCTIELIRIKYDKSMQSSSEKGFFGSCRDFLKNYLKPLNKLKFSTKLR